MNYKEELQRATNLLAENGYIFIGQNMVAGGTSMYHMVKHLPIEQRIELPVMEEVQMGMSIGMSLEGIKVCSTYPRMDFLILAINQLVNHADKIRLMSNGQFKTKGLIIRCAVGSTTPMFSGEQHSGNYVKQIKEMVKDMNVVELTSGEQIYSEYEKAMNSDVPTLLVEYADLYNMNLIYDIEKSKDLK
jgi:pyruvate/2-oxoglutarate/acetoin dehydrogenase E1 component